MSWQPIAEKESEWQLIIAYADKKGYEILKLQNDDDDGGTDGIVGVPHKGRIMPINVEARRKGYPNHKGEVCLFKQGWETKFLIDDGGVFLNESTIMNHKNRGFIYLVDINGPNGSEPRCGIINHNDIEELLKQPFRSIPSTNSGVRQSVKTVPLSWFKEY